ncbi:thioredoxin domain-containing protein [Geotalea uraniireducens]|nr:thioredoxin domain-containing protein [Geotalea uraniireducens]
MIIMENSVINKSGRTDMKTVLLWSAVTAGLVLAVLSALKICTAACSESTKYDIFGIDFGWFGVVFFIISIVTLGLRNRGAWLSSCFSSLVFAGFGAELRFLWLQKFVIGRWCPLCLWIAVMVFVAAIVLVYEKFLVTRMSRGDMKSSLKFLVIMLVAIALGAMSAMVGVRKEADAAGLNIYLGKQNSPTTVYFVSDWFCPGCRRLEPKIEKMYPALARQTRIAFIDYPIHPETSNYTPYNLQFLVYEKDKYIQLRRALSELSMKVKAPSNEQVQAAVAPYGVKLRQLNFMDVMNGVKQNESIYRGYGVNATPTVVVANEKTKKRKLLVGDGEITSQAINAAISAVEK